MKFPRPSLRIRAKAGSDASAEVVRTPPEDDARLLRRTRFRLMAISGAVTLVILVLLGVSTYGVVSGALTNSDQTALDRFVSRHSSNQPSSTGPEAAELGGEGANLFEIYVMPSGRILGPGGNQQTLPVGLPNLASLEAARNSPSAVDLRTMTAPDGTPYTVETVQAIGPTPGTWFIQFVQNRAAEVRLLSTLFWILLAGGALAFLAALGAGYLYAGRALVPIRASIERRQAALQRQREFTANASHELRTPLTIIRASVEDLRRNSRSRVADVGDALDDMDAEVKHLTALVEDMLLLARTDSGVMQLDRMPLDLADITVEASSNLAALGQERGVSVVADPLPTPVLGDPLRLRQLVTILVDNAVRHSPSGSEVAVRVRPANGAAFLWVEDQGHGVKPEDLPRLFERFWRADNAPAGGTGLGLSIARWIVEQHGGRIGAENRTEGGARFWVQLPLISSNASTAADAEVWANPEKTSAGAATGPIAESSANTPASEAVDDSLLWPPGEGDEPSL